MWFYHNGSQNLGPFKRSQIRELYSSGKIHDQTPVSYDGETWEPAVTRLGKEAEEQETGGHSSAMFLYIPTVRLIALTIVSSGLYQAYWIYRNWHFLKERDGMQIQPFWRGVFGVFYIHPLLGKIKTDPACNRILPAKFSEKISAVGWIILVVVGALLVNTPIGLLGIIINISSVYFLLPVQTHINTLNQALQPRRGYHGWSIGQIVSLVPGLILWFILIAYTTSLMFGSK